MKPRREVWLAIEEAQSALTILDSLIEERLSGADRDRDRKQMAALVGKARASLDKGQEALSDAVSAAQAALGRI